MRAPLRLPQAAATAPTLKRRAAKVPLLGTMADEQSTPSQQAPDAPPPSILNAAPPTMPPPPLVANAGPPPPLVANSGPPPPSSAVAAPADGDDSDTEVIYVAIDLPKGSKVPADFNIQHLKNLSSSRPTLELAGRSHAGKYEMPLGTHYFFTEKELTTAQEVGAKRRREEAAAAGETAVADEDQPEYEYTGRIDRILTFD